MKKYPPLKIIIPGRLRPHIKTSFSCRMGYSEQQAVIYMIQNQLMADETKGMARKYEETLALLRKKT